jgi:hypothetical protein
MSEAALPTDPTRSILGNLYQVVIVLFWQHDNKLKSGLSWMEVHINHWLSRKGRVPNVGVRGLGDQAMSLDVRGIKS